MRFPGSPELLDIHRLGGQHALVPERLEALGEPDGAGGGSEVHASSQFLVTGPGMPRKRKDPGLVKSSGERAAQLLAA